MALIRLIINLLMKITKNKIDTHQYITYRTNPKSFEIKINKPKPKNPNPLYSTDSLAKYFNLPPSNVRSTTNRKQKNQYMTERFKSTKMFRNDETIIRFNQMQENLRLYQQQGNLKHKLHIIEEYNTKIQDHFLKIKNSTNYDDYPRFDIALDATIEDMCSIEKILKQSKRKAKSLRAKTLEMRKITHAENIKKYSSDQQKWIRYGYSLEVQDPEEIVRRSIEKRNRHLRQKCGSSLDSKKIGNLKLKQKICSKNLMDESKHYLQLKMKTEGDIF